MMVSNTQDYWVLDSAHRPMDTTIRKLDLFLSSGERLGDICVSY
jgi:hypothetical protein